MTNDKINEEIRGLVLVGYSTLFEDGMDNQFTPVLDRIIRTYGAEALCVLKDNINDESINPALSHEITQYLGEIDHSETHGSRLDILTSSLFHKSASVRDGAGLGLYNLKDVSAIPALKKSIQAEKVIGLRGCQNQVLDYLESIAPNTNASG